MILFFSQPRAHSYSLDFSFSFYYFLLASKFWHGLETHVLFLWAIYENILLMKCRKVERDFGISKQAIQIEHF